MTQTPDPNPYENTQYVGQPPATGGQPQYGGQQQYGGDQWTAQSGPHQPPQTTGFQPAGVGAPYPTGPQQTSQPGQPMGGPYGPPYGPPAAPGYFQRTPLPNLLAIGSGFAGVITFFMGFLAWITVDQSIEHKAQNWAEANSDSIGIPAFYSPSLLFSPGWFFLGLGALGVAAFGFVAVRWLKYLPFVAFGAVFCWMGLLACSLALPGFISLGVGAIIALILGAVQAGMLVAATIMSGLAEKNG